MENGLTLKANRKYVYRYSSDEDKISAWFVKEDTKQDEGKEEVDDLFHDLEIDSSGAGWSGRGEHLCSLDMYVKPKYGRYRAWLKAAIALLDSKAKIMLTFNTLLQVLGLLRVPDAKDCRGR